MPGWSNCFSDVCNLRRSRRRRTARAGGRRCRDQCAGKYLIFLPLLSIIRPQAGVGRWRSAQQYSRQRAGRQGMQLCHRIECHCKARERFGGNPPKGRSRSRGFFSTLQVIMRQHHDSRSQDELRWSASRADLVVTPDVTSFDISEFTRGDEMARIGEITTNATVAKLSEMLNKLDPQLFKSSAVPLSETGAGIVSGSGCDQEAGDERRLQCTCVRLIPAALTLNGGSACNS